ncbi:hypothetical protein OY671_011713, partial [Metschnikowia pulcherrima]
DAKPTAPAAADAAAKPADAAAAPAAAAPAPEAPPADVAAAEGGKKGGSSTPVGMFLAAGAVVKVVMIGSSLSSVFSWVSSLTKIFEFAGSNKQSDKFSEAFRGARSIADIARISSSEEFEGNPMADMAAAASQEVESSRQAGSAVAGEHRDSTSARAT